MITKLALWVLGPVAVLLIAIIALLAIFQRSLIYPIPPADGDVPQGFEVVRFTTSDGLELKAGFRPAREEMPTLLFFHGNATDWQSISSTAELAIAAGYGVLAAEYRGYSGNPGEPDEEGLYRDGRAALDWLQQKGVAAENIVLVGNSLGSGTATQLASETNPRALIIISGFKSLVATASNAYPWLPVDLLLQDRFDNIAKFPNIAAPILVVHGSADQLIPIDHARDLARANPMAHFVAIEGFGHALSPEEEAQQVQLDFLAALAR